MEYNPFDTAIKRKKLSKPTRMLLNKGLLVEPILNYGCGFNEDSIILKNTYNTDIIGYDKFNEEYHDDKLLERSYQTVICNYVLNVIPDLETHHQVVEQLKQLGKDIYICVRADEKAIRPSWRYESDTLGYWTSANTFQRLYNKEMVKDMFGDVEYIVNDQNMKLFKVL